MPQPDRLPGTPEFRIKLPQDGAEARGCLLTQFGGNGTNKFLLREGSLVTAEEWPLLDYKNGATHQTTRMREASAGSPFRIKTETRPVG